MRLLDHEIICFSRKTSFFLKNEHYEIPIRSRKNYSNGIFVEKVSSIKFPDC